MKLSKGDKILVVGGIVLIVACLCVYNIIAYETQREGYDQKYEPITLDTIPTLYFRYFWLFTAVELLGSLYIGVRIFRWYMREIKETMKEAIRDGIKEGIEASEKKKTEEE